MSGLGYAPDDIEPGRFHRFATSERRRDDAGWCKLFDDLRGGVFGCYRQGISETWTAERRESMTPVERAKLARQVAQAAAERQAQQRQQWAENAKRIASMQAQAVALVPGDAVTLYLKRRGFGGVWPLPACLRFHRALAYWDGAKKLGEFPAMLAPLVVDGHIVALHRTYLTRDGAKADVPSPKKLTGTSGPLDGACIPLMSPRAGVLGIAEGIETALGAWCASTLPVVAAYSAGSLSGWRWPPGVQRIVIFADQDKAGAEAADTLRARAIGAGIRCEVTAPTDHGTDWCDVWAARGAAAVGGAA